MKTILLLFCAFSTFLANAQAGSLDTTFNTTDVGFGLGDGANGQVLATLVQPDGKIIIAGQFSTYNGTASSRIARLNIDGTLDPTFVVGIGASDEIRGIAMQPDGKIVIVGNFNQYNGTSSNRIARLNANGSLDTSFVVGVGFNDNCNAVAIQTDGKILIGGRFSSYNGTNINSVARLNSDGSLDAIFSVGTGANDEINTIVVQTDGKIVIGGIFTSYNAITQNRLARLNANGTLDTTFVSGTGADTDIKALAIQADGKIIIGGNFSSFNATVINRIARINSDGSLDTAFTVGTGANSTVHAIKIQPDGKILIGGDFFQYNSASSNRLARLNINGTLDNTFVIGTGSNQTIRAIETLINEKILIAGGFTTYNGIFANRVGRINTNGSFDATFNVGSAANLDVITTATQADGKIIIGGFFTKYYDTISNYIARLNTDGALDATFSVGTGFNSGVNAVALQTDGKIIAVGLFTSYNGTTCNRIVRLNTNGSIDTTFNVGTGADSQVQNLVIQPDGKIVLVGMFTSFNGFIITRSIRLNTDGSRDTTFNPGAGADWFTNVIKLQSDGKMILGGNFGNYNNVSRNSIVRINSDGSLDTTFVVGTGTAVGGFSTGNVTTVVIQADGKVVIGGGFTSYNGTTINRIARLNTNGTLDTSFAVGTGANDRVQSSAMQLDGKIIFGGLFTNYNSTAINRLIRVNTDGSLDATFNVGTGVNANINTIQIQPDGKLLIGGTFISYNGIGRNRIARINRVQVANTLNFDGSNDYVTLPRFDFSGNNKVTIEAWIKPTNITTKVFYEIARQQNPPAAPDFLVSFQGNGTILSFGLNTTTGYSELDVPITASQWTDGNWHHVAVVYDGVIKRVYKDGVQIGFENKTGNIISNAASVNYIGFSPESVVEAFHGNMDEVRYWNRALCLGEILNNKDCQLNPTGQANLYAYYQFNQGEAGLSNTGVTALTDVSGNSRNGTLTNFGLTTGTTSNWVTPGGVSSTVTCSAFVLPAAPTATTPQGFPNTATIVNLTTTTGVNIQWYAAASGGTALATATALVNGTTYHVSQTVNGCESARTAVVAQTNLTVADNQFSSKLSVYPNPSNGVFNIEIEDNGSIQVYDLVGKQIMNKNIQSGNSTINLSSFSQGIYFLKITNDLNQTKTVKIIKD